MQNPGRRRRTVCRGRADLAGFRPDHRDLDGHLRDNGNRPHVIRGTFVWDLPKVGVEGTTRRIVGAVLNDWQISGVFTGTSGPGFDSSFSYNANGQNVNLTGSPNYGARIVVNGDPGRGCSSDVYRQFNTSAFSGPGYNSLGLESGANLMSGCFERIMDLSLSRNIRLGAGRRAQLRVDAFNVFNTAVINGRVTQLQLNSPTDFTVRNSQYLADGTLDPARLTPRNAGYGAASGAQALRTIEAQLRFSF